MTSTPSAQSNANQTPPPEKLSAGRGLEGFWQGTLNIADVKLRLVLKLVPASDGTFAGTLDSPDQGALNLPLDTVTLKNQSVHLRMARLQGAYQGMLNEDGSAITGSWKQRGRSLPLTFTRLNQAPNWIQSALAQEIEGVWQGRLGRKRLRLILKLARASDGTLTGMLDSPDQGGANLPIDALVLTDQRLRFSLLRINAAYEGTLNKRSTKIVGRWKQRDRSWSLTFKRLNKDRGRPSLITRAREFLARLKGKII